MDLDASRIAIKIQVAARGCVFMSGFFLETN
jgi:hypothetical protein